jgi:hypothetical protein
MKKALGVVKKVTKSSIKKNIRKLKKELMALWTQKVKERAGYRCEYCGVEDKEIKENGKPVVLNAHHLVSRSVRNSALKFNIDNGICLCTDHHKFNSDHSFHKNPVQTIDWLIEAFPERFNVCIDTFEERIDLDDIEVLNRLRDKLMSEGKAKNE